MSGRWGRHRPCRRVHGLELFGGEGRCLGLAHRLLDHRPTLYLRRRAFQVTSTVAAAGGLYRPNTDRPAHGVQRRSLPGAGYTMLEAADIFVFGDQSRSRPTHRRGGGHGACRTLRVAGGFRAGIPQLPRRVHDLDGQLPDTAVAPISIIVLFVAYRSSAPARPCSIPSWAWAICPMAGWACWRRSSSPPENTSASKCTRRRKKSPPGARCRWAP